MPSTIVTFGDSTTAERAGVEVYTALLANTMAASLRWLNRGIPGNTTEMARARFDRDVLRETPQIVIIQFGINDATVDVWMKPPAGAPRVSLERYEENLRYFIGALRLQAAKAILMTPNPVRWTEALKSMYGHPPYDPEALLGFMTLRDAYVDTVRRISREEDVPLADIDLHYREWERETGRPCAALIPDGMHPGTDGHHLVADALRPILKRTLVSLAVADGP